MKIIELEQGTPEWLQWRRNHITASDMAAIMGKSPWKTQEQLFYEKLGLGEPQIETQAMKRGKELESIARQKLNERMRETNTNFLPTCTESVTWPYLAASLDGFCDAMAPYFRICEIKTGNAEAKEKAKAGIIPEHYRIQIETQLLVSEADLCYYAFYDDADDSLEVIEVRPDLDLQVRILEAANEFWERLQNLDPPEPRYEEKQDDRWQAICDRLEKTQIQLAFLQQEEKMLKEDLVKESRGRCCKGYGYGVVHSVRQGSVDYKKVVEDYHVDEAKYRKEPTQVVTVRKMK